MSVHAGPTVRIRDMTGYDVAPLAEALGWPVHGIRRRWAEALVGHRDLYVAEVDGRPAGSVSVNEREEFFGYLHLFALDVAPAQQSRGTGTCLIAHVEGEARARGLSGVYLEVSVENHGARRLYERLGYEPEGPPHQNSWNRYDAKGDFLQEVVEMHQRMVKRF